ncbi:MAG: type II toxin-antitoxin system antitoxin SocA domain-containing protein [Candidatus Vogelbacteria bacterium]
MTTRAIKSPYTAENVAKYFIYLASQAFVGDNKEREGITNLKLQKVLYFAQAYYLSKIGKPLFSDNIEAWEYGPVIPEVYHKFKTKGSNPIICEEDKSSLSDEDKENLRKIWGTFGGYSASRLVDITHAHIPWKEANKSASRIISHKAIKEYYAPLLNK